MATKVFCCPVKGIDEAPPYEFGMALQGFNLQKEIKSLVDVPGYFDFADVYAWLAHNLRVGGIFVEVGALLGKSTVFMAKTAELLGRGFPIFVVDTFEGSSELDLIMEELRVAGISQRDAYDHVIRSMGVEDRIVTYHMPSVEAATQFEDEGVEAVFLDGAHDKDNVLADLKAWWPKICPGGVLMGHDTDMEGVTEALAEFFGEGWEEVSWRCWLKRKE